MVRVVGRSIVASSRRRDVAAIANFKVCTITYSCFEVCELATLCKELIDVNTFNDAAAVSAVR